MAKKGHVGPVPDLTSKRCVAPSRRQHDGDRNAIIRLIQDGVDREALVSFNLVYRYAGKHLERFKCPVIGLSSYDILPMNRNVSATDNPKALSSCAASTSGSLLYATIAGSSI